VNSVLVVSLAIVSGWASQYGAGMMAEVVHNRTNDYPAQQLAFVPDLPAVAVADCGRLNVVMAANFGGGWQSIFVADCARDGDGIVHVEITE